MTHTKDGMHLGNSQWCVDKTCWCVFEEFMRSDRAVINRLHTNIVHTSTLACG